MKKVFFSVVGLGMMLGLVLSCADNREINSTIHTDSLAGIGKPRVLVVMSGSNYVTTKEGNLHPTGYFLSELAGPTLALKKAGFEIKFATPHAKTPVMDKISDDQRWFKSTEKYQEAKVFAEKEMKKEPISLETLTEDQLERFYGVFVPGGHAPLEDLKDNQALGRVFGHFHKHKKPTALICHGPAALLSAKISDSSVEDDWIYKGYHMTSFSAAEEKQEEDAGHLDGHMPFYLDEELRRLGGNVEVASPWTSFTVRDRELITGQNPMSEEEFTKLFLESF